MDAIFQDIHILFVGILLLIFSATYLQHSNRIFQLDSVSIASIFYFAYVLTIFIPSFWTFYGRIGYYRYAYIYTLMSPLVTVPVGILIINVLFRYKSEEIQRFHSLPINDQPKSLPRILNYCLVLIVGIAFFCCWVIEQKGNPIPLLYMLSPGHQSENLGLLREYSFKLLDSKFRYLYHLTRDFVFPLLILVGLGNYYYSRNRPWFFLLSVSFIVGLFFAGANISKASVFGVILLIFANMWILKGARMHWWQIALAFILALAFPVLVLMSAYNDYSWTGFSFAFEKMMERIFYAPSSILYYGFEIVPEHYPFQMGRFMGSLAFLFGKEPSDLAQYSAWYITGNDYATTSVSGAFVTELYGDFGFPGVILGGVWVGMVMQWIQITIIRSPKTLFAIATYVLFIYFFSTLTYLQIGSALILSGAPILWLLYKSKLLG